MNVTNYRGIDESLRRNRQGPKRGLIIALLITMFTYGGVAMAQKPLVLPLETAAKSALSGDPSAIRVLTDTVISRLPLTFHPSLNIQNRLFGVELQYRKKIHPGVSTGQLVSALNHLADDMNLPKYVKTNANQIRTYRMLMLRAYPTLFESPYDVNVNIPSDSSLSPSAATFLILHLLQLKLIDPGYQTDPDTWVNVEAKRKQTTSVPKQSTKLTLAPLLTSPQYDSIAKEVATNSGSAVGPILLLLNSFGI